MFLLGVKYPLSSLQLKNLKLLLWFRIINVINTRDKDIETKFSLKNKGVFGSGYSSKDNGMDCHVSLWCLGPTNIDQSLSPTTKRNVDQCCHLNHHIISRTHHLNDQHRPSHCNSHQQQPLKPLHALGSNKIEGGWGEGSLEFIVLPK